MDTSKWVKSLGETIQKLRAEVKEDKHLKFEIIELHEIRALAQTYTVEGMNNCLRYYLARFHLSILLFVHKYLVL